MTRQPLTQRALQEALCYDPDTGVFTWLHDRKNQIRAGMAAGTLGSRGRVGIYVGGRVHAAARLAWLYVTGEWPEHEIDHEDRNPSNNRWLNLRPATRKQNNENRRPFMSFTGMSGVYWHNQFGKWAARIGHNKRIISLGCHDTLIDAVAARIRAERKLYTHSERCAA